MSKKVSNFLFCIVLIAAMAFPVSAAEMTISEGKGAVDFSIIYSFDAMYTEGDSFTIEYMCNGTKGVVDIAKTADNDGIVTVEFDPGEYTITNLIYNGSNGEVDKYAVSRSFTIQEGKKTGADVLIGSELIDYYIGETGNKIFIPGLADSSVSETDSTQIIDDVAASDTANNYENIDSEEETKKPFEEERTSFWDYPFTQLIPLLLIFGVIFAILFLLHKKGKI